MQALITARLHDLLELATPVGCETHPVQSGGERSKRKESGRDGSSHPIGFDTHLVWEVYKVEYHLLGMRLQQACH